MKRRQKFVLKIVLVAKGGNRIAEKLGTFVYCWQTMFVQRRKVLLNLGLMLVAVFSREMRAETVDTAALNRAPQVIAGFNCFYSMEYDCARVIFQRVEAEHRGDALATDYLLNVEVFEELNRLDLLDTTFYATNGFLTGNHLVQEDPKVAARIKSLANEAVGEADARLKTAPNDVDALFARGWAKSLEATYIAMAERGFGQAFRLASQARSDCRRALEIDPDYVDAKLVVGVYEYVVGALPWAFKLLIGFMGIHGSKAEGMAMLQEDASQGVITGVDANTAIMLFLRREAKYGEAIAIAQQMSRKYPHNFLFSLEIANLEKDKGMGMTAVYAYRQTIANAKNPGFFHHAHLELAYFGLGESLRGQKHYAEAESAYQAAAKDAATSPELKQRCLLAAGETYDLAGNHVLAVYAYQRVIAIGHDSVEANKAREYLRSPYRE
jgi:tetratricopeptide (TPR) repeat protein